ncbi:MAG: flagellar hook-basal body complex protein FliE [Planctomycetaceae bacterium]|nr:flagellar hook-basal body complex protein FliE [Planctomycetaceae bacterium]
MAIDFTSATNAYTGASRIGGDSVGATAVPFTGSVGGLSAPTGDGSSFSDLVRSTVDDVVKTTQHAESVSKLAMANKAELHELVTAISAAEVTVQTVVAVRDRMITAYQDIIKMPI